MALVVGREEDVWCLSVFLLGSLIAGRRGSELSHTIKEGKRNMLPSQTKHSDCNMLFVDRRCAAGDVSLKT